MKGKIKFAAPDNPQLWTQSKFGDTTKKTYPSVILGDDGNEYTLYLTEGKQHWTSPKGTEVEFEVKEAPQGAGKRGLAKFPNSGGFFGGKESRREYKTPTPEQAADAAKFSGELNAMVKEQTKAPDAAAAIITAALIERLC